MNGPFQVAQANIAGQTPGKPPARIVKIGKPFSDQSVVVALSYDGSVKADLSAIAGEKITLVHIGEKLIILFDNKSTVTLEPFFDSTGKHYFGRFWRLIGKTGFPNQVLNDSWVVGFWRADHGGHEVEVGRRAWTLAQAIPGSFRTQGAAADVSALYLGIDWTG